MTYEQQKQYIIDNYANMPTKDIAQHLGLSISQVYAKAHWMRLKKSPEYMKAILEIEAQRLRIVGAKCRYSKGHIPANKGQKMPSELYEKIRPTMFKKGNQPHNTMYDGHEVPTKDGYIKVRISKGNYQLKHRVIWEQHNGKVPDKHVVIFKDGNKLNFDIDNLQLISIEDNMRRNTIHRYPEEIKQTIKTLTKLKKQINEKQN